MSFKYTLEFQREQMMHGSGQFNEPSLVVWICHRRMLCTCHIFDEHDVGVPNGSSDDNMLEIWQGRQSVPYHQRRVVKNFVETSADKLMEKKHLKKNQINPKTKWQTHFQYIRPLTIILYNLHNPSLSSLLIVITHNA